MEGEMGSSHVIRECSRCGAEIPAVAPEAEDNLDRALYVAVLGAYGEFRDTLGVAEVLPAVLCHGCGHALMAGWFPDVDVSGWH